MTAPGKDNDDQPVEHTPRRIVWVMQGNEGYGVAALVLNLAAGIRERGWHPIVVTHEDGQFTSRCREEGIETVVLGFDRAPMLSVSMIKGAVTYARMLATQRRISDKLERVLRELKADAIHFTWGNLLSRCGIVGRRLGIPVFWEMPNRVSDRYPLGLNRRIYQWQCKRYGILPLADSAYTASTLGDRPVKPIVFYHCVDDTRFEPDDVEPVGRDELDVPEDAIVLGIVARLHAAKGQDRILQAMLDLADEHPSLHLLLIGGPLDEPFARKLRDMAEHASGSTRKLHLLGLLDDPQRYYGIIDIAINARIDPEPFGISVIEAMLMNKPVLAHALGGPAETVVDGVTGWHVDEPTVPAFTEGLRRALGDRSRWVEMGQAGRKRALDQYTIRPTTDRYQDIVEKRIAAMKRS